jgi:dsRNA-specific ribonuclease
MKQRREELLQDAWIGDAVLSLYARRLILAEHGAVSSDEFERMTSNQFLSGLAEPSSVEAEIGRAYAAGGIEAGFQWIETNLMPLYRRQQEKRQRASRQSSASTNARSLERA